MIKISAIQEGYRLFSWPGDQFVHFAEWITYDPIHRPDGRLLRFNPKPHGFFHIIVDTKGCVEVKRAEIRTVEQLGTFQRALERAYELHAALATGEGMRVFLTSIIY